MTVNLHLSAGARIGGDFRIIKPLNAGGMGAVYVAEQETTGKPRALKLMHRELVADAKLRERFEQEARVGSMIPSDHIVQVIGAGVDQATGMPWLAMELLEGEDLAAHVGARGPIPADEALALFEQLCHGLGAAHAAGVVHRDMKPENIFLAKTRTASSPTSVKILDFGIARVAAEAKTAATAAIGTPLWMAPEQSDPRAPITPSADVWSLGLIAFKMLTGRTFWRTASDPLAAMTAVMREILFEPIAPASRRAAELGYRGPLPEGFDAWFARCVARDVKARFADASEAMRALRPALSSTPIEIRGGSGVGALEADGLMETQAFIDLALAPTSATPGEAPIERASTVPLSTAQSARIVEASAVSSAAGGVTDGAVSMTAKGATTNPDALASGALPMGERAREARAGARRPIALIAAAAVGAAITTGLFSYLTKNPPPPAGAPATTADPSAARAASELSLPPQAPPPPSSEPAPAAASSALPAASASAAASAPPQSRAAASANQASLKAPKELPPFDAIAAQKSLAEQVRVAQFICAPREGPRAISVTVYFAPSGNALRVEMDPFLAGTGTAMCARGQLLSARVPPFRGAAEMPMSTVVAINNPFGGQNK